ncbi:hypothetical protein RND71_040737 [Anisodus tanguticus]|uniref:YdbS-like PH domain-containing protein n=1 Tax=Anisodus tanguticus TaxID=243964 RepID=A0AAE1QT60_9SOLA|nr:hypothetical protein RND71_040737 [Anisodus tanguticus]
MSGSMIRRLLFLSGLTVQDWSDFSYKVIKDVQVVPRFIGEWGDVIITLEDGTILDLRSVPKFREIAKYCFSMADKDSSSGQQCKKFGKSKSGRPDSNHICTVTTASASLQISSFFSHFSPDTTARRSDLSLSNTTSKARPQGGLPSWRMDSDNTGSLRLPSMCGHFRYTGIVKGEKRNTHKEKNLYDINAGEEKLMSKIIFAIKYLNCYTECHTTIEYLVNEAVWPEQGEVCTLGFSKPGTKYSMSDMVIYE